MRQNERKTCFAFSISLCTYLFLVSFTTSDAFSKIARWGNIPKPLRTSSFDDGYSLILSVSLPQLLANLSRSENSGFEKILRRNLHRSKEYVLGAVPHTCFFYNYPVE